MNELGTVFQDKILRHMAGLLAKAGLTGDPSDPEAWFEVGIHVERDLTTLVDDAGRPVYTGPPADPELLLGVPIRWVAGDGIRLKTRPFPRPTARIRPEIWRSTRAPDQDRAIPDRFATDGFAVIPGLFDPTEIAEIRETLDQLFSDYHQLPAAHSYDLDHKPGGGEMGKIPGIRNTLRLKPDLRATRGIASAVAWAERLVGSGAEVLWDAAIYKPSGKSSETPWHQDEAVHHLSGKPGPRWMIYFWVALDDVDAACGAIRFLPGSHRRPLLPHAWRDGTPNSSLVVAGPIDAEDAATIPLGAGDATVHHPRTMHGSGPNLSDRCRKAWILGVGQPKVPRWIRRLKHGALGWVARSHDHRRTQRDGRLG